MSVDTDTSRSADSLELWHLDGTISLDEMAQGGRARFTETAISEEIELKTCLAVKFNVIDVDGIVTATISCDQFAVCDLEMSHSIELVTEMIP